MAHVQRCADFGLVSDSAHGTVATALRTVGERLMAADGERVSGVVIVPYAPTAQWWGMLRHFLVVGRCEAGHEGQLVMCQIGTWRPVITRRAFVILAFPLAAGALTGEAAAPAWEVRGLRSGSGRLRAVCPWRRRWFLADSGRCSALWT